MLCPPAAAEQGLGAQLCTAGAQGARKQLDPGNDLQNPSLGSQHPSAAWCLSQGQIVWTLSCGWHWVGVQWFQERRDGLPFLPRKQTHRSVERHCVGLAAGPPLSGTALRSLSEKGLDFHRCLQYSHVLTTQEEGGRFKETEVLRPRTGLAMTSGSLASPPASSQACC